MRSAELNWNVARRERLASTFPIPHSAFRTRGGGRGGMIRIIAGEFKGRRLKTPAGDALKFAEQLHPGQYDVAFADPPYASGHAARLVALFRVNPFARIISIEHPADQPIPGDDTRRYGDTAVTFIYAP